MRKLVTGLLILVALSLCTGLIYQWQLERSEQAQFPPPGELLEVDNLTMHLDCRGQGSPTVIMESGLMSGSSSWGLVHDELATRTRICAYDRPGMDWSEPGDEPLSAPAVARRLHSLLDAAGIDDNKILVGMSAGGVFVREYYRRHGADVVGMVLVDSSHEQQGRRLPEITSALDISTLLTVCSWLQPFGVVRAFDMLDETLPVDTLPASLAAAVKANANQSHSCHAMQLESEGFQQEVVDSRPPASLGDLPLVVLSQGRMPDERERGEFSREQVARMRSIWDDLQLELTGLSTRGRRVVAENSGHLIQLEQPQLVVREISTLLSQLRAERNQTAQALPNNDTATGR